MSRIIILNDIIKFEPEKKNLVSRDSLVHISAPASYCFQLLIEKQGELVTHEELYQYAWRQFGMEATANTLYQNISVIRRGLDKCGLQEDIIRTMPRRGFILSPAVKIQYSRTRDLAANALVQGYHDTPLDDMPTDHHLPEVTDAAKRQNESSTLNDKKSEVLSEQALSIPTMNTDKTTINNSASHSYSRKAAVHEEERSSRGIHYLGNEVNDRLKNLFSRDSMLSSMIFLFIGASAYFGMKLLIIIFFNSDLQRINYTYLAEYNGCQYYTNDDGETGKLAIDKIHQLGGSCQFNKYKYFTKFTDGDALSLISCRRKIGYFKGENCMSEFITGLNDD